jgi:demethylmenaquinone methyltransferase/2-methoxy-6-polyprenyl-1,4-benzoquinol methylase
VPSPWCRRSKGDAPTKEPDLVYVEGSSTPVAGSDADGNTYQVRRLDDGSEHRVMKNFPDKDELRETIAPIAEQIEVTMLTSFWALSVTPRTG